MAQKKLLMVIFLFTIEKFYCKLYVVFGTVRFFNKQKEREMKKLLVVLMIAALSILAISCQKKAQQTPAPADTTAVTDTAKAA